ncbi:MAG: translocation/assembly module TamB domain-containing protein [Paraprevotella sp.]|nr:translocation/assembly module TamB domain-containing protein [Paraprevotella sp.]
MKFLKNILIWLVGIMAAPVCVIAVVALLLYVPVVQDAVVRWASDYASQTTGYDVRVQRLRLSFPLDVRMCGVRVLDEHADTLLSMGDLTVDLDMAKLWHGSVGVDELTLEDGFVDSKQMIPALTMRGRIGKFTLSARDIDLLQSQVRLSSMMLERSDLNLMLLPDTTAADTTTSSLIWEILLEQLCVHDSHLKVEMPQDTMTVEVALTNVCAIDGRVDLGRQEYALQNFVFESDSLHYDVGTMPRTSGVDPNHIRLAKLGIQVDSIRMKMEPQLAVMALLNRCEMQEECGLQLNSFTAQFYMDSMRLNVPRLELLTSSSRAEGRAEMELSVLESPSVGNFSAEFLAEVGKHDVLCVAGDLPRTFHQAYPDRPIELHLQADGNLEYIQLKHLRIGQEGTFHLNGSGKAEYVMNSQQRTGQMQWSMQTHNIDFVKTLIESESASNMVLPSMRCTGEFRMQGTKFDLNIQLQEADGSVSLEADFDTDKECYSADLRVQKMQVDHFLPNDSMGMFSAYLACDGHGFDFLNPATKMNLLARIDTLMYGELNFDKVQLNAHVEKGKGHVGFDSKNELLYMNAQVDALMRRRRTGLTFSLDLHQADFYALRLTPKPFKTSMCLHFDGSTNLSDTHSIQGGISDLTLTMADTVYRPKDVMVDALLSPDTLYAYLTAGDFLLQADASGSISQVMDKTDHFLEQLSLQAKSKYIDHVALKPLLPQIKLKLRSGRNNPVSNYMAMLGYRFNDIEVQLNSDPLVGLNGMGHIYSLNNGAVLLDSIQWNISQDTTGVLLDARVCNGPRNKQFVFDAGLQLSLQSAASECHVVYKDGVGRTGVRMGVRAEVEEKGLRIKFVPMQPIIAFRNFRLNPDNFVYFSKDSQIEADIDLLADDGTGLKLYSIPNPEALQDLSVSVNSLNLGELSSVLPYMPRITGFLHGDVHLIQTTENLSVMADLNVQDMTYEKAPLGNIGLNTVYLPNTDGTHFVDSRLSKEGEEVLALTGTYQDQNDEGWLDAQVEFIQFPLSIANGFVSEGLAQVDGVLNGTVSAIGEPSKPMVNGEIALNGVKVRSTDYSLTLRLEDDIISVQDNLLQLSNLKFYSLNENPLVMNGKVDFRNLSNVNFNTQITAKNFELVNGARSRKAITYGKVYVDVNAMLRGTPDEVSLRGSLNVLGNTDVTYVLKDSPLTVEDRLSELVTFVDFADTLSLGTPPLKTADALNLSMNMRMSIDQAAQVHCILSADHSNYIDIEGGGDMTMSYTPQGELQLHGRYTVVSGAMKYSWFVIPLKTFALRSGSYVEFTGDVLNPILNVAATERVRTTVTENNVPRTVAFDVGLSITQRLENMGLEFTLEAPEDLTVQNELASMSTEQRGRLAVTMLATGMYLADSNLSNGGLSTQNALNAFLQSEISHITGNALKTIDLTLGMENATSADGDTHTDYSFQFAKRFWGNRISVIIGGKVSTGNEAESMGQNFIDNVSLEYRLDQSATRYVKLFYDRNYESLLEGDITEMGAGLVLRRKVGHLGELFIFKKKENGLFAPRTTTSKEKGKE